MTIGLRSQAMLPVLLIGFGLFGCKKPVPAEAPAAPAVPTVVDVKPDAGWIFTYATDDGRFETTTEPGKVPDASRSLVRAVNPGAASNPIGDTNNVMVVDLRDLAKGGAARARPMPREVFETRALAGLAPGASSPLAGQPSGAMAGAGAAAGDAGAPAGSGIAGKPGSALVTLYGTSWCGACQSARRYFIDKGIPFVDKDIERDAAAAAELREKAARFGIAADRIPILDVRGRLLIGFDPSRVERILGETAI